jgi:catechol 2,3-dioxygenase-like lactoylglutathione lyase family enzyme
MSQVRYIVNDVSRAVEFYTVCLGFELLTQYGPAMAIVRHGNLELWLAGPMASASRPMPNGDQPVSGGWNRIVITVGDIDERMRVLRERGVIFRSQPVVGPGGAQVVCDDPSGNPIELFQPN